MNFDISSCGNSKNCPARKQCKRGLLSTAKFEFPRSWINGEPDKGSGCVVYLPIEQQSIEFPEFPNELKGIF